MKHRRTCEIGRLSDDPCPKSAEWWTTYNGRDVHMCDEHQREMARMMDDDHEFTVLSS